MAASVSSAYSIVVAVSASKPDSASCSATRSALPAGMSRSAPVRRSSRRCASAGTTTTSRPPGRRTRANSPPLRGAKTLRATSTVVVADRQRPPEVEHHARRIGERAQAACGRHRGTGRRARNVAVAECASDARRVVAGTAPEVGDPRRRSERAPARTARPRRRPRRSARRRRGRAARHAPRASRDRRRSCVAHAAAAG